MVFHWSLSDSKSPQVTRNILSILTLLTYAVVLMVSTRPPNFKSYSPFNNPLVTVPKAPISNGITVTFMFPSFFNSTILLVLSFLLIAISSGFLADIRWSVYISMSYRSLCVTFSMKGLGCAYIIIIILKFFPPVLVF